MSQSPFSMRLTYKSLILSCTDLDALLEDNITSEFAYSLIRTCLRIDPDVTRSSKLIERVPEALKGYFKAYFHLHHCKPKEKDEAVKRLIESQPLGSIEFTKKSMAVYQDLNRDLNKDD